MPTVDLIHLFSIPCLFHKYILQNISCTTTTQPLELLRLTPTNALDIMYDTFSVAGILLQAHTTSVGNRPEVLLSSERCANT